MIDAIGRQLHELLGERLELVELGVVRLQTLHVLGLTVSASLVTLALNLLLGADFPGFAYLISPVATALLWAPVTWLLYSAPVRRRRETGAV